MLIESVELIVLYTTRLEAMRIFYETLGFCLEEECHSSNGHLHYSTKVGSVVLELYPGDKTPLPHSQMIGFKVTSITAFADHLESKGISPTIKTASWGKHITMADPDGRKIQFIEPIV